MQYPLTEGVTGSAVYSADGTHLLVPAVNLHAAAEQTTRNEQMEEFMFLGLRMRDGFYRKNSHRHLAFQSRQSTETH